MGFDLNVSVPILTVFLQGLLSFFSPCVFPLIPLYISYLSGGTLKNTEDGQILYDKKKVILNTLFFIIGISFAFFILGLGFSALGSFFKANQILFSRIGGILIFTFGLYQLGFMGFSKIMGREYKLPFNINYLAMSPLVAFLMGFTFSFAWTPCVGPALASVLLMTASAKTTVMGFMLIGVYTLGFVLPFLAVGLFTTQLLEVFKKHRTMIKYTIKIGGVLLVIIGLMMFTGTMNSVTGYLSKISGMSTSQSENIPPAPDSSDNSKSESSKSNDDKSEDTKTIPSIDFTLTDQYGKTHTLSDYKGKTVFLNFWATWCGPCRAEMPDIQKIYESYNSQENPDVIILGIAAPNMGKETTEEGIKKFLKDNGYTYPVLMDNSGEQFFNYGVSSFPTTYMIDTNGNVFGYVSGSLSESIMKDIIKQTIDSTKKD